MEIGEAREYLKSVMSDRFTDRTFENYINRELAGDFAVEVASLIKALDTESVIITTANAELQQRLDAAEEALREAQGEALSLRKINRAYRRVHHGHKAQITAANSRVERLREALERIAKTESWNRTELQMQNTAKQALADYAKEGM